MLAGALIAASTCFAASGRASVVAWFKADGISGVGDGGAVTLWQDVSGSGNNAQAGTAPTLAASAINGLPAVHFDADDQQYLTFPRVVADDFTMIVVFRSTQGLGTSENFYDGAGLVNGEVGGVTDDFGTSLREDGCILAGTGNPDATARTTHFSPLNDGDPHFFTFERTRSTGALALYADDLDVRTVSGAGTQSLTAPGRLVIGAQQTLVDFFDGDIAEIKIYDTVLSDSERLAEQNALKGKYGMAGGAAPSAPANLAAAGSRLQWDESTGAAGYEVLRATSADGPYEIVASDLKTNAYTDATAGGTFYYAVRAVNSVGASAASASVEAVQPELPANGRVVINEIHYNGASNATPSDFIELYNYKSTPTDIGGWRISGGVSYTFPSGTVMQPGAYLVVAGNPATVQALFGAEALGPYDGSLSSDGETVRLRDVGNTVVCEVPYSSGFPWPCAANGDGASAELMNPALDPALGSSWRASINPAEDFTGEVASPGFQNYQYVANPPPNIEDVAHSPMEPAANAPITVTARVTDSDGVASVNLLCQFVAPGSYIPACLPYAISNHQFVSTGPLQENPAFENPANWTTIAMHDDGANGDETAGDGLYTAVIPGQPNRTLVRYRVAAADSAGKSDRAPFADDRSKNFACFVYNGVPDYQGVSAATLTSLPTYHFLTRKQDYDQCVAYSSSNQLSGGTPSWTFENWEAALVFEGKVYDHIRYRLHGGNGRYYFTSKRAFRFFFNSGYDFQNRDNDGNLYPTKWNSLTTENCWENRGTLTYSLNEIVNFRLWNTIGVPAPLGNWGHFRTIMQADEQPDAWHGDFWGLIFLHEDYDRRFLDAHNLEKGNLYKLTRDETDGPSQQRYQAPDAVADGSDHANIRNNLRGTSTPAFIDAHVNIDRWSYYHALCQAVRHYDYWPSGDNNAAYYFEPAYTPENNNLGKLWILPNDVDATWGPTWNNGHDIVYNALFDASASSGGDSATNPTFWPTYFNAVREVRDLLWQQDQINPLLDEYAAVIAPFLPADSARWKNAPSDAGNYDGLGGAGATSLAALVQDMKNFAWVGGSWPGGDVGSGGRAAFLDTLQLGVSNSEGSQIPNTPAITYAGSDGFPVNGLKFTASAFSDPQGAGDFSAVQWRVAEVTDPSAPAYDPSTKFKLEWTAAYDSGALANVESPFAIPPSVCTDGHAYRARVRYRDVSGRWSHWSAPVQFIAGTAEVDPDEPSIVISEFLYHPLDPTSAEAAQGFTDAKNFEYIELLNTGAQTVSLAGLQFTKGITYTFGAGVTLAPGARIIVASNPAGFEARFGTGKTVVGPWSGSLDNAGEHLTFALADGTPLIDFTYDDVAPWPVEADTEGYSLVLKNPFSNPNPALPENWRISSAPGGNPDSPDSTTFDEWAAENHITSGAGGDEDNDGVSNRLEYAFALDPNAPDFLPGPSIHPLTVDSETADYLTISFTRPIGIDDLAYHVEFSADAAAWEESAVLVTSTPNGDGTVTQTWRAPASLSSNASGFLRTRVSP